MDNNLGYGHKYAHKPPKGEARENVFPTLFLLSVLGRWDRHPE